MLGHAEGAELLGAEDLKREQRKCMIGNDFEDEGTYLGHLLVGDEELLVLGVLEVVLLEISPELLDALGAGSLLLADDLGEVSGELHGLGQSLSFRHVEC